MDEHGFPYPLNESNYDIDKDPNWQSFRQYDSYVDKPSAESVLYSICSLVAVIFLIPCTAFFAQRRNFPVAYLLAWSILYTFIAFINSLIWPTDNISIWYDGRIWCDIVIKLQLAGTLGMAGGLVILFRTLANALSTDRVRITPSFAYRARERILESFFCIVAPIYIACVHYCFQTERYVVWAIYGCNWSYDDSWLRVMLMDIWAPLFLLISSYNAVLVTIRVWRYRTQFAAILQSSASGMSKTRFIRLYALAFILLLTILPTQIYVFSYNLPDSIRAFDWALTHSPDTWNYVWFFPTNGKVFISGWIRIATSLISFIILGIGGEANEHYRKILVAMGLGAIFKRLNFPYKTGQQSHKRSSSFGSLITSKARSFAKSFSRFNTSNGVLTRRNAISNSSLDLEKGMPSVARSSPSIGFSSEIDEKDFPHSLPAVSISSNQVSSSFTDQATRPITPPLRTGRWPVTVQTTLTTEYHNVEDLSPSSHGGVYTRVTANGSPTLGMDGADITEPSEPSANNSRRSFFGFDGACDEEEGSEHGDDTHEKIKTPSALRRALSRFQLDGPRAKQHSDKNFFTAMKNGVGIGNGKSQSVHSKQSRSSQTAQDAIDRAAKRNAKDDAMIDQLIL